MTISTRSAFWTLSILLVCLVAAGDSYLLHKIFFWKKRAAYLQNQSASFLVELRLQRFEMEDQIVQSRRPHKRLVCFFGDSVIELWPVLQNFKGQPFLPVNRGISGETTGRMLDRFQHDVVDLGPSDVIVIGGCNDVALGIGTPAITAHLTSMCALARRHPIRLFIGTIPPRQGHETQVERLNQWIRDHSKEMGYHVLDFYRVLGGEDGTFDTQKSADHIHPNTAGYSAMASLVLSSL